MVDLPAAVECRARVMTYNVHGFVGSDGAFDPERTASIIERSRADLVALQEVEFGQSGKSQRAMCEWLGERLSMRCHFTLTRSGLRGGDFGNAVLSRHAFELVSEGSLPRRGGEARAVQWLRVRSPGREFHLMNTHFSPWFWERRVQVRALLGAEWLVRAGTDLPLVVCGDFNASPFSGVYRRLSAGLLDVQCGLPRQRLATWPSRFPLWRIDHVFVSPDIRVLSCDVTRDALTRSASDHLPMLVELDLAEERRGVAGANPSALARKKEKIGEAHTP